MAVVLETHRRARVRHADLDEALQIFRDSLAIFEREKDDLNWAAAQNNLGNVLLALGERESGSKLLEEAVAAFRAALEKRDRATRCRSTGRRRRTIIGIALYSLSEREAGERASGRGRSRLSAALEEYTRDKAPVQWAMVQNNLGNTLDTLGTHHNDTKLLRGGSGSLPRRAGGADARQLPDAMGGKPAQSRQRAEQCRQA